MRELPELPENLIMLVEVGSTAHGTGLPNGEDLDLTGVVVETSTQVLGLSHGLKNKMQRTQPEGTRSGPGDIDRTLYSLRNFLRLCHDGNPTMLMTLWAPIHEITSEGEMLRAAAPAFIGRHVIPRYRGYMQGQALRLLGLKGRSGHGKRGGGGREELISEHGFDTKYAVHCARLGFQCIELLTTDKLTLPISHGYADWLRALRAGGIPFNEWWEKVLSLDADLEALSKNSLIRPNADRVAIQKLSEAIHLTMWDER